MANDQIEDFIERADELWLQSLNRTNEQKAEAFDMLLLDFCILMGMLKALNSVIREPDNG
ncbi:MAG TPA: hypothetical protein VKA94_01270 [Hyphomicrobiales bacterium]|nr:hypothetical protein [Hyphomicrobiales bacterium]